MSQMTLGRFSNKMNNEKGSTLHKDLMLTEASNMGYKGLQKATKEELNSLVNGYFKTDEEYDAKYEEIKLNIKNRRTKKEVENNDVLKMGLSDEDLKIIRDVDKDVCGKIALYYEDHINSMNPELNLIENGYRCDEETGLQKSFTPTKKELKWAKETKAYYLNEINKKYNMMWNDYYDMLFWAQGEGSSEQYAPRKKDDIDYILSIHKDEIDLNDNNNNDIVINKCLSFVPSN